MQDIHSIGGGGGGGRLFGGDGGSDRRLRPHNHQKNHHALRCPRCDSLNTKFCYYNNYNLSQPRHFCKCCHRYWTIGGVLRNVPIGSGCRKTKRSNPKQKPTSSASTTTNLQHRQQRQGEQPKSSNSHSSSESSSLTATNTASTTVDNTNNTLNGGVGESKLFSIADSSFNPNMEARLQRAEQGSSDCVIFSEIESFASLIDSSNEQLGFGFSHLLDQQGLDQDQHGTGQNQDQPWQHQHQKMLHVDAAEMKMQGVVCDGGCGGGLIDDDQMVRVEYSKFDALDWPGTGDHGVLDLHAAVDQAYWSSQS